MPNCEDRTPDCRTCGKTRTILLIRQVLNVPDGEDVVAFVAALRARHDEYEHYITRLTTALGDHPLLTM